LEAAAPSGLLWDIANGVLIGITLSFAPIVVMDAAHGHFEGEGRTFEGATKRAVPWLPRYLWTNVHTSLIFWLPMLGLINLGRWLLPIIPTAEALRIGILFIWGAMLLALALYLHTRTVLAPYLAIHADLSGTIATYESWRISGLYFRRTFLVFVLGTAPVALPVIALSYWLAHVTSFLPSMMSSTALSAIAVIAHWTRPLLIPAVHALYVELWQLEKPKASYFMTGALPWFVELVFQVSELLFAQLRRIPRFGEYWRF